MDILSHFPPGFTPRPIQAKALREIDAAFESGKRFVFAELPAGTGKSHLAVTLARAYGPTYILTLTKQLQAQYVELFEPIGLRELKGRAAFPCPRCGKSCAIGGQRYKERPCGLEDREYPNGDGTVETVAACEYKIAKARALAAPITVCNYQSYFYNVSYRAGGRRPLVVLDEAHSAEDVLLSYISIVIDAERLPIPVSVPLPRAKDVDGCFEWLVEFLVAAENFHGHLDEDAELELRDLKQKATFALECRGRERWIAEALDKKAGFALKPLTVRSFGERLFRFGDRVLLMSATILDAQKMAESLGISWEEAAFVSASCPFPVENRRIECFNLDMRKSARGESWPIMAATVGMLLEEHKTEKGLILTPSDEMMQYLLSELPDAAKERLVLASGVDRLENYNRHCRSPEPTVLLASGYWEGADLFGDRSRFQIIPAAPRPCFQGQVAARAKMDDRWYRWRTFTKLIQGCGRSVRSGSDFSATYVLDGALKQEAQAPDTLLPAWFREAIIYV